MLLLWIGFVTLVVLMLVFDLCVLHRRAVVIGLKQALLWSAMWIAVALSFNVALYYIYKHDWMGIAAQRIASDPARYPMPVAQADAKVAATAAKEYFGGYILEKSLSVDNLFVMAVIFSFFGIKAEHQHRVLFWGILGALVMRGIMIGGVTWVVHHLHWMTYVFGLLLILTAVKMLFSKEEHIDPDRNPLVRLVRHFYPVTSQFQGARFVVRQNGRWAITPLLLALLVVETTDLLFAIDSIPAIIGLTADTFIVFTSNIMAILGLRALYFALAGMMREFEYLKLALVIILAFVGVKMLIVAFGIRLDINLSLAIIVTILTIGVVASIIAGKRQKGTTNDGAAGTTA